MQEDIYNQRQKRKIKALKNTFKTVKYCYFFLDSQLNRQIQIEQNTVLSKDFTKPAEYTSTTSELFSARMYG